MKKYLLGIIAIVLAAGLSSFTADPKHDSDDVYYFYIVNSNGVIPEGASVQFGGTVSLAYADLNDGCSGSGNDCMRGFLTQPSLPTSASGNVQTTKN